MKEQCIEVLKGMGLQVQSTHERVLFGSTEENEKGLMLQVMVQILRKQLHSKELKYRATAHISGFSMSQALFQAHRLTSPEDLLFLLTNNEYVIDYFPELLPQKTQ